MTLIFKPGELVIKIQRWPVLGRDFEVRDGVEHLKRGGYKRTAEPTMVREEKLIRLESRSRALVSWDIANAASFSLGTGRCVGDANWLLTKESLKALRKLAREQFPKEKATEDASADAPEEEDEGMSPMEIAGGDA